MTTINGMPISNELADYLMKRCPTDKDDRTFFTAAIDTISNVQDFICVQLGSMESDEKEEAANYLSDIVILKKDLAELVELLPIIDIMEGGLS